MNNHFKMLRLVWFILFGVMLSGCMSGAGSDAAYLLEQDHHSMTDSELISYEQELSDELVKASRSDDRDVGVGIGLGSWGSNVGFGVHADKWFGGGGDSETTRELKLKRDEARQEMRNRGLLTE